MAKAGPGAHKLWAEALVDAGLIVDPGDVRSVKLVIDARDGVYMDVRYFVPFEKLEQLKHTITTRFTLEPLEAVEQEESSP